MKIFVLHRGWVVVGKSVKASSPAFARLESAYVIRRWGTTRGLGEIAEHGPTKETILDECPPMEPPLTAIINTIECNDKAWEKWIRK